MARSRQPSRRTQVSTSDVVDAALEIIGAQGLTALSIRSVAAHLGLSPMSVYRYVDSKDALLDLVILRVLSRMEIPHTAGANWRERIVATMTAWRNLLIEHAEVVPLLIDRPVPLGSEGLARIADNTLANLEDAGIVGEVAVRTFWQVFMLTIGQLVFELPRRHLRDEDMDSYAGAMAGIAEERGFTRLRANASQIAAVSGRGSFHDTLDTFLVGVYTQTHPG